jgi:hypothetical protein
MIQKPLFETTEENTETFESFWKNYPPRNGKKSGKQKALQQWQKLSSEQKQKARASLNKQKEHYELSKKVGAFVPEFPDAFRWIRDRRFDDELTEFNAESKAMKLGRARYEHAQNNMEAVKTMIKKGGLFG